MQPARFQKETAKVYSIKINFLAALIFIGTAFFSGCGKDEAPNGSPASTTVEKVVFTEGFYNLEKGPNDLSWRWMGEAGSVKLKNFRKDSVLKFVAEVPMRYFPTPPSITITLNGQKLEQFTATPGRIEKIYNISAAQLGGADYADLKISTDKTFVPKEVEKNSTDPRKLGVQLDDLAWDIK